MTEDVLQADEAERAVIGGLLIDPTVLSEIGTLTASDFYRPAHASIFAAVRAAVDSGERVDQLVVLNTLRVRGDLERVGGASYLHDCQASIPSVANTSHYARFVQEAAKRRKLLEYATRLRQACLSPDLDSALDVAAELSVAIGQEVEHTSNGPDPLADLHELGAFAAESITRRDWVIPGLLERMDRVIVVAGEGAGKSMWMRSVAAMVGQGIHPLNPTVKIPPQRALIVDLENPPNLIRRKARHLVDAAGGWESDRVWVWSRPGGINLRKAADQALLDHIVAHVRPALVCLGPLYKASLGGGDRGEQIAAETASALDRIRERHGCALWLEHHAPMAQQGERNLRPVESGLWSRWPEFGIAMRRDGGPGSKVFRLERFRGDRDERCWPDELSWGSRWPFDCKWDNGMPGELYEGNWNEGVA